MNNDKDKLIQSVAEVFSNEEIHHYRIPNYQRGYKWNSDNVTKLLTDLKHFEEAHNNESNEFYCLQNITILPCAEDGREVNVVDGQQRLTTLYIILSFLKFKNPEDQNLLFFSRKDCLCYDIRKETADFLMNQVFTGNIWHNENICPDTADRKDQYYLMEVAKATGEWFNNNSLKTKTVTDDLRLIINNIKDIKNDDRNSETALFSGLNGGKVDLDGADLVRAILITRSSKEKYPNEVNSESALVMTFRQRIAMELDEMNLWWSGDDKKHFFEQFLPKAESDSLSFDHKQYSLSLLYKLFYVIYKDVKDIDKIGIEFFENGLDINKIKGDNNWELYQTIINFHTTLKYWFEDFQLYHWIGLLIFGYKGDKINLRTIWNKWQESSNKNDFLFWVVSTIAKELEKKGDDDESLIKRITNIQSNWYDEYQSDITQLMTLMDVLVCTGLFVKTSDNQDTKKSQMSISNASNNGQRLNVEYFHKNSEDYEHIRSCTPNKNEGKESRLKSEWIDHLTTIYGNPEVATDEMIKQLFDMVKAFPGDVFDDDMIHKMNILMNQKGQNSIGNLVLLDRSVNRGNKNACFQDKIQTIFNQFINGQKYIRPYTMIVFERKVKDKDKVWRWTYQNIEENARIIAHNVELFYNIRK